MDYAKQQKIWAKREAEIERLMDKGWKARKFSEKYGISRQRAIQLMDRVKRKKNERNGIDQGSTT